MKRYRIILTESEIFLKYNNKEFLETMYPDLRNLINRRNDTIPSSSFILDKMEKDHNVDINVEKELEFYELQSKIHRYLMRACLPKHLLIEEEINLKGIKHYEYFSHVEVKIPKEKLNKDFLSNNDVKLYLEKTSFEEQQCIRNAFTACANGLHGYVGEFTDKVVRLKLKY